jgi:hypothetical protein
MEENRRSYEDKVEYYVEGTWDGVWWILGSGATMELAHMRAAYKPQYREVPLRLVKATTTFKREVVLDDVKPNGEKIA